MLPDNFPEALHGEAEPVVLRQHFGHETIAMPIVLEGGEDDPLAHVGEYPYAALLTRKEGPTKKWRFLNVVHRNSVHVQGRPFPEVSDVATAA